MGEAEADGAALGFTEVAGLLARAAGLVAGLTVPAAEGAGLNEEAGPVAAGDEFVTVAEGPAVPDGPGLGVAVGVAELDGTGGGKFFFTRSVRLLEELLFCA